MSTTNTTTQERTRGTSSAHKWVWLFEEGGQDLKGLLGGKGAGVAEMTRAGLPVPPGFTITTEACNEFYANGKKFPEGMWDQVLESLSHIEEKAGKKFGDPKNPLLVSVRSGAKFSMPGMMDTVLNLGLNEETLRGVAELTGDDRFALDAYRRFIQLFGKIVLGIDGDHFEHELDRIKVATKAASDAELTPSALRDVIVSYKKIVEKEGNAAFPEEPVEQLRAAIGAVFDSWNNKRAIDYRNYNKIPHDLGTAVNVQTMVFGNMGNDSGTGVAFTRDPNTGERVLFGEYLINAQGEDVVAGIRTPQEILSMREELPHVYRQFEEIANKLERHYRDVQDMEFTIEKGRLYMLQTRSGKRTAEAAVNIAVAMVKEKLISKKEAVLRVEPQQINQLLHRQIDPKAKVQVLATGLAASPGAATGTAVFDADRAEALAKKGEKVILIRIETNPDDVHGMIAAEGVLTARGGRTSHAAVVARGMGKPCVAGVEALKIDLEARKLSCGGVTVTEGDVITIDGGTGRVIVGTAPLVEPQVTGALDELLMWADSFRRLEVWANADYPRDAKKALEYGAQGIGLCRTEHMFMEQERLPIVQKMILASTVDERKAELARLLPIQRSDFEGIFTEMAGKTVVIRLIDPPLHEFLPSLEELLVDVTKLELTKENPKLLAEKRTLLQAVEAFHEQNPMLGLRGCRLGLLFPEIIVMQSRAIMEAALAVSKTGKTVHPEIMVPLVGHLEEFRRTAALIRKEIEVVFQETGRTHDYLVGTMIELPRAALTAGEIATEAEFFSFGTNDLTQTTLGFSRDDAEGKFLQYYLNEKVLTFNPFESIDRNGVGRLMKIAVTEGRHARKGMSVGICGEHGGDPDSIEFCESLGMNYVSCSPYRVPVARMAAAHARLKKQEKDR